MSPNRKYDTLEELIQHWRAPEPSDGFVDRVLERVDAEADDEKLSELVHRWKAPEPSASFTDAVMDRVAAESASPWRARWRWVAAVAALLLLTWAASTFFGEGEEPTPRRSAERSEPGDLYALHAPLPAAGLVIALPVVPGADCDLRDGPGASKADRIQRSRAW
ncbi:MAG: hypothetical protein RL885_22830 [Planctomycetota bacterium]